jgi:RNA polymerase sigma-70 factor (ECF subfamily)
MTHARSRPEMLIQRARAGDDIALGRLLELYRNYLRLVARSVIGRTLRLRLDPSDLVQETFLVAHREFPGFAGSEEPELAAWLRRILVRNLTDQVRHHGARRRDDRRHESLEAMLDRSGCEAHEALACRLSSPSSLAARREHSVLMADAMAALPDDYREILMLRYFEHLTFDAVAARMGRSSGAVRMLWVRALERLGRTVGEMG